jgi:parallel beta-helix repeat protein
MSARTRASSAAAGGGDSFLVVAALDTPAKLKSRADYVCDGTNVTGGDEVEINTALGVSNVVILCPGTFWTSQPIVMASNKGLIGGGAGCQIKFRNGINATRNMIVNSDPTNGNDHITIRNLKLDGNKANNTGNQEGIWFTMVGSGVGATAKAGCIIEGCFIENFNSLGIDLEGIDASHRCTGNKVISNTLIANDDIQIYVLYADNNVISNNIVQGGNSDGISLDDTCDGNVISDNICQGNTNAGIDLYGSSYNTVSGNVCQDNNQNGIQLAGGAHDNVIVANHCQGNRFEGIYIHSCQNNTISGNTCQGNDDSGIYLNTASNSNTISGNNCQGNDYDGIEINNSLYNTVSGNTCQGNGVPSAYAGIYVWSLSHNNIVIGNIVRGSGASGICISTSNNNVVSGNFCTENSQETGNTYDDILIEGSDRNNVEGNVCRAGALVKKPQYGINITSGTGNMLTDNDLYNDGFGTGTLRDAGTATITVSNRGYNPKGNVANPYPVAAGNLSDSAAAQAFPTSATNYTVSESPKLITIYGGTITSVSIDGVATGQAGAASFAAYRLEPGQVLNVVWTVQPSSVVYAT